MSVQSLGAPNPLYSARMQQQVAQDVGAKADLLQSATDSAIDKGQQNQNSIVNAVQTTFHSNDYVLTARGSLVNTSA